MTQSVQPIYYLLEQYHIYQSKLNTDSKILGHLKNNLDIFNLSIIYINMLEEQIKNSNEESISRNISITKQYSKVIHVLVLLSKILIIVSGLLSFSSTKFDYWLISFSSGSLNFLATSLLSYSSFLQIEKKKITKNLNQKLQILGIKQKLLISNDASDESDKSQ